MSTSTLVGKDSVTTARRVTEAASDASQRKWEWRVLAGILVGGAVLRLIAASGLPLWYDESVTFVDASSSWGHLFRWEHNFFAAPGYELLAKLSLAVFGVSELALRLPALLFGISNLALVYVLARRATDAIAALSCSALLAIAPVMVATDAYGRCYSTWLFCVLCTLLLLTSDQRLVRVEQLHLSKVLVNWCSLAVLVVLGFWVHMLNAYVALAVFVALAVRYFQARRACSVTNVKKMYFGVAVSVCAGIVLCLPGILKAYHLRQTHVHAVERAVQAGAARQFDARDQISQAMSSNGRPSEQRPLQQDSAKQDEVKLDYGAIWAKFKEFMGTRFAWLLLAVSGVGLYLLGKENPRLAVPLAALIPACFLALVVGLRTHDPSEKYFYPLAIPIYLGIAVVVSLLIRRVRARRGAFCLILVGLIVLGGYRCHQVVGKLQASFSARWMRYQGSALLLHALSRAERGQIVLHSRAMRGRASFYRDVLSYDGIVTDKARNVSRDDAVWLVVCPRSLKKDTVTRPWLELVRDGIFDASVTVPMDTPGVAQVVEGKLAKWYSLQEVRQLREYVRWNTPTIRNTRS
ncbi:MAG: glycosyltransferase family 39 protein [Planctomycetota bacterium]|nr:glycosyltransferase family 39 protein [Planctomycetota bacterium]